MKLVNGVLVRQKILEENMDILEGYEVILWCREAACDGPKTPGWFFWRQNPLFLAEPKFD